MGWLWVCGYGPHNDSCQLSKGNSTRGGPPLPITRHDHPETKSGLLRNRATVSRRSAIDGQRSCELD